MLRDNMQFQNIFIDLKCLCCGAFGHTINECEAVHLQVNKRMIIAKQSNQQSDIQIRTTPYPRNKFKYQSMNERNETAIKLREFRVRTINSFFPFYQSLIQREDDDEYFFTKVPEILAESGEIYLNLNEFVGEESDNESIVEEENENENENEIENQEIKTNTLNFIEQHKSLEDECKVSITLHSTPLNQNQKSFSHQSSCPTQVQQQQQSQLPNILDANKFFEKQQINVRTSLSDIEEEITQGERFNSSQHNQLISQFNGNNQFNVIAKQPLMLQVEKSQDLPHQGRGVVIISPKPPNSNVSSMKQITIINNVQNNNINKNLCQLIEDTYSNGHKKHHTSINHDCNSINSLLYKSNISQYEYHINNSNGSHKGKKSMNQQSSLDKIPEFLNIPQNNSNYQIEGNRNFEFANGRRVSQLFGSQNTLNSVNEQVSPSIKKFHKRNNLKKTSKKATSNRTLIMLENAFSPNQYKHEKGVHLNNYGVSNVNNNFLSNSQMQQYQSQQQFFPQLQQQQSQQQQQQSQPQQQQQQQQGNINNMVSQQLTNNLNAVNHINSNAFQPSQYSHFYHLNHNSTYNLKNHHQNQQQLILDFPFSQFDNMKTYKYYFPQSNINKIQVSHCKYRLKAISKRQDIKKAFKKKLIKQCSDQLREQQSKSQKTILFHQSSNFLSKKSVFQFKATESNNHRVSEIVNQQFISQIKQSG